MHGVLPLPLGGEPLGGVEGGEPLGGVEGGEPLGGVEGGDPMGCELLGTAGQPETSAPKEG